MLNPFHITSVNWFKISSFHTILNIWLSKLACKHIVLWNQTLSVQRTAPDSSPLPLVCIFLTVCLWHLLRLKYFFPLWLCTSWISFYFFLTLLSHFHSSVVSFKKQNNDTEGVKFHRALLWKENDSFVKQLTARTAADLMQLGRNFWEETLPWAVFSPFEGHCSFCFNQGEVCENL